MTAPAPDPDCIFCDIIAGRREASVCYEDDENIAFMDLRQPTSGHSCVIPKRHVRDIFDLDRETGTSLLRAVQRVASATRAGLQSDGVTVWQSNIPPFQEVLHIHFHVMARFKGDSIFRVYPGGLPAPVPREELDRQAALIRGAVPADEA